MPTPLHTERLDFTLNALLAFGARSVVDLGCGAGELLQSLVKHAQFKRLVGIDIDPQCIAQARAALGLDWLHPDPRIWVREGSFAEHDGELTGFDAAVLLETIEHVDPGRLPRVERAIFAGMHPTTVLVTTPNREYNPLLGMQPSQRRHPGHCFEWNRAQFKRWATRVAEQHAYCVRFTDIGGVQPGVGGASQAATFQLAQER